MKNNKILSLQKIAAIGLLILFVSCDFLDVVPEKNATLEYAFGERKRAMALLATCYSFLPTTPSEAMPGRTSGPESYQYKRTESEYPIGWRLLTYGNNKTNPYMNFWDGANGVSSSHNMFIGIRCCDILLDQIRSVPDMEIWEKILWEGEVKFLKAYYHWWLMLHYGPIPTIRESLPIEATPEQSMVFRDPMDVTMEYIIELIDEAIPMLQDYPSDGLRAGMGRITKPIAMAMKAKILTFYASPFFNGNSNPIFANFTDKRGIKLFPEKNDEKWVKAMEACAEAIELIHSLGNYYLYRHPFDHEPEISDSMKYALAMQTVMTEPLNSEQIWSVYGNASSLNQDCFPVMDATTGTTVQRKSWCPTMWSVEQFWSANGVPIEEDREWADEEWYKNRFRTMRGDERHRMFIEEFEETAILHFNREYRFYGSVGFDRARWYGAQYGTDFNENNQVVLKNRGTPTDETNVTELNGKRANERFFITGYNGRKIFSYNEKLVGSTRTTNSFPWCEMRLADLYLLYAEARNEVLSQPDAYVYDYVNMVRERVGLSSVEQSWENSSINPNKYKTKNGMREIIHQERVNELMYEGHLYYDIRRWSCNNYNGKYDILKLNNMLMRGWNIEGTTADDFYVLRTIRQLSFSERELLWPLMESTLIQNSNLVQNPGWD